MEGDFGLKEEFVATDGFSGVMTPPMSADDAFLSGFLPELTFQSVLQPLSLTLMPYSPLDRGVPFHSQPQMMAAVAPSASVRYGFVNEEFPKMETTWRHGEILDQKLKMPKQERLNTQDFAFELLQLNNGAFDKADFSVPLINFFSSSLPTNPSLGMIDGTDFTGHFSHLPLQKSFEPLLQSQSSYGNDQYFQFQPTGSSSSSFSKNKTNSTSTTSTLNRSAQRAKGVAKKRRQRMSDKILCLEKLLPWNRRMDTATMLEEVYKYIKFLQAQIRVLLAMPIHSTVSCSSTIANEIENQNLNEFRGGVLARLNRQQLLEVLMNSPGAQTVLYSRGSCVYSLEQLLFLKQMAEKAAMEQMFFPSSQY